MRDTGHYALVRHVVGAIVAIPAIFGEAGNSESQREPLGRGARRFFRVARERRPILRTPSLAKET